MSQTKLLKTDSSSKDGEPVSAKPKRISGWFRSNRWFLVGAFVALVMARSEAKRAETLAMQQNRQAIEEMSRVKRDRLRHNQQQFQQLSRKDVQRFRKIHDATQNDPKLDKTITEFHSWLATLSMLDREELMATSNVQDRLQIIRRLQADAESSSENDGSRRAMDLASRNQFTNFRVPLRDYERMMSAGAAWAKLPAEPKSGTSLGQLEYHTSVLTAILDEALPGWRLTVNRTGNRPRPMFPDELRKALLEQLSDPSMRQSISGRPLASQNVIVMTLLARGLFDETRRVAASLKPTDEELDRVLQNLPEARRKLIGNMPKEMGDRNLQQMWVSRRLSPEAGESLSRLWNVFEKLQNRPPSGHGNGVGTNRQRFNGGNFRPNEKPQN